MKNVFIDSNIWLSLYHFSDNDLNQFGKLKEHINFNIKLYVTSQVEQEILRNRENKLKEALKDFHFKKVSYPAFCQGYTEHDDIRKLQNKLSKDSMEWRVKIDADIKMKNLPADKVIEEIFSRTKIIDSNSFAVRANQRYLLGNPPGKKSSYGDAINWECLLENIPNNEDLYFISADQDFASVVFNDCFNDFLCQEWEIKKGSKIYFYKDLPSFLSKNFQNIKLDSEIEKGEYIEKLADSTNFNETHSTIAVLSKYSGWTQPQYERLAEIALNNNQVLRILRDPDVFEFYYKLLENVEDTNASKSVQDLRGRISEILHEEVDGSEREFESELYDAMEEYFNH